MSQQKFYKVSVFALPIIPYGILKDRIKLDEYLPEDLDDELIAETRGQILQKLNNAKSVSNIKEVLSKREKERFANWVHAYHGECFRRTPLKDFEKYPIFSFEPIMFSYEMPLALQDSLFPAEYPNESFRIILDGVSIFLAGLSPIRRIPSGIPDIRDKIVDLISEPERIICSSAGLGLSKEFVFVPDSDIKGAREWDVLIESDNHNEIDTNLKMLYLKLYDFLNHLYDLHLHLSELEEFAIDIDETQETIFKKIGEYVRLSSWRVLDKNRLMRETEKLIVNAFIRYSGFAKSRNSYARNREAFNCLRHKLLGDLREDLTRTFEMPAVDEQLFHQTLEKAQKMLETYSLSQSNIIAGAIGGVVVFLVGQIINYLASR